MPDIELCYARLPAEKELIHDLTLCERGCQSFDGLTQVTILVDFSQKALSLSSRRIAARTEALQFQGLPSRRTAVEPPA
jgi:hypothetical protein